MSKPNILGNAFSLYMQAYDADNLPEMSHIISTLRNAGIKFKDSSINSMLSVWKKSNGIIGKRGKQKQERTLQSVFDTFMTQFEGVEECPSMELANLHLINEGFSFKDSTLNSMFSTWRSKNGFGLRKGRKPKEQEVEKVIPKITGITNGYSHAVKGDKKYQILDVNDYTNEVTLLSSYGTVFEVTKNKLLSNGYVMQ